MSCIRAHSGFKKFKKLVNQFLYSFLGQYGAKFLHAEHTNYKNLGLLDVYLIITNKKRRLVVYIWVFLSLRPRHDYPNKKFATQSKKKNKKTRQRVGPHVAMQVYDDIDFNK